MHTDPLRNIELYEETKYAYIQLAGLFHDPRQTTMEELAAVFATNYEADRRCVYLAFLALAREFQRDPPQIVIMRTEETTP